MCDCDDNYMVTGGSMTHKARKVHKCCECRRKIDVGELYERTSGLWRDSGFASFKTCAHCAATRDYAREIAPKDVCFCPAFGELTNEINELIQYSIFDGGYGLARLYHAAHHRWRYRRGLRKGQLMPVPCLTVAAT